MTVEMWLLLLALVVLAVWVVGCTADSVAHQIHMRRPLPRITRAVRARTAGVALWLARFRTDLTRARPRWAEHTHHRYSQED